MSNLHFAFITLLMVHCVAVPMASGMSPISQPNMVSVSPSVYNDSRHNTVVSTMSLPDYIRTAPSRRHASSVSSMAMAAAAVSPVALAQVLLTPLPRIPGTRIKRYLGPVSLHFIKDSWSQRGESSLGSFAYLLLSEVNALARAHVAALGGNALLCYSLTPQEAGGRVSRNQGFTMFSATGDAVLLEFHMDVPRPTDLLGLGAGMMDAFEGATTVLPLKSGPSA